jgi:hypothetical protein
MARLRIVSKLRDVSSADFRPEMCLAQSILSYRELFLVPYPMPAMHAVI